MVPVRRSSANERIVTEGTRNKNTHGASTNRLSRLAYLDLFYDIAHTIDDAVVTEFANNQPKVLAPDEVQEETVESAPKRPRFKFSMVGIKIGEWVTFDPTGIKVRVASDNTVEYDNRLYKLSPFVGTFLPAERRTPSNAYQGSKYFSYNGKVLEDLRREKENAAAEHEADGEAQD